MTFIYGARVTKRHNGAYMDTFSVTHIYYLVWLLRSNQQYIGLLFPTYSYTCIYLWRFTYTTCNVGTLV